jgi:hypothetical protein
MALTASVELGPNRWIPAVLEAGGMAGILVLVWINGLMAVLRYRAGPVVKQLSPTGVLLGSAALSGVGLLALSFGGTAWATFGSATVFAVGVCYFWPTMLGVVSERVPKSGALGLGLMGAVGTAVVGLVTSPMMGQVADRYSHEQLPVQETMALLESSAVTLAALADDDAQAAARSAEDVLAEYENAGSLPRPGTANALRAIIASDASQELVDEAQAVLGPADNYGGLISFRFLVPLCGVLTLIFGTMYMRDRRGGGYVVERIGA